MGRARRDVVEALPEAAARGILAHELSHAVHFKSLTGLQRCALMARYALQHVDGANGALRPRRESSIPLMTNGYNPRERTAIVGCR